MNEKANKWLKNSKNIKKVPRVETFVNLRIFAKVYTCENVLFWHPAKMYFLGVCVKLWKIGPKTPKNVFVYLTAKVYTHESFQQSDRESWYTQKCLKPQDVRQTLYPGHFLPPPVRNMCFPFIPWAFIRWGIIHEAFFSARLLSVGHLSAGLCPFVWT